MLTQNNLQFSRSDSVTVQAGKVAASAWMDRKTVMVMSTNGQPSSSGTVTRKQRTIEVLCPESIISYNKFMGGGDQLRGYYSCRSRSRKLYKYIFFLFDVAITNAYVLLKSSGCAFKDYKSFRLRLAKDLIGSTVVADAEGVEQWSSAPFHSCITLSDWETTMGQDIPVDIVLFIAMFTIVVSSPPGFVVSAMSGCAIQVTQAVTAFF